MNHNSDRNRNRSKQGGTAPRKRPENQHEALIQDLQDRESSLNAVFFSVREPAGNLTCCR
jgi:hypothetical protein